MGGRNSTDAPSQDNIRNQGGIPFASQIPNDAAASGEYLDDAVDAIDVRVTAVEAAIGGATNPFNFAGTIAAAAGFPTAAAVVEGDVYVITADVIDGDATKTNTGLNFLAGSKIVWDGTTWQDDDEVESGIAVAAATPYNVPDGIHTVIVDTATIAAPSVVNLPALSTARKGRSITVIDGGSGAGTNAISVTPDGTDEIDNVNAAKDISINDGAMTVQTEGVGWYTNGATAHALGDGSDHANVALNDTHRASAGLDHSYLADNLVDVVVAVADASGGATDALMTVQVNDLAGTAVGKVCEVMFYAGDTQYAGLLDPNANITIGTVTAGSVLASAAASGWWLLKTDATGLFAATATNAVDETVYFNAATCEGGVDGLTAGVVVRGCVPDDATWAA